MTDVRLIADIHLPCSLAIYGAATFQQDQPRMGVKTLSGREIERDPLQVEKWLVDCLIFPCLDIAFACPYPSCCNKNHIRFSLSWGETAEFASG